MKHQADSYAISKRYAKALLQIAIEQKVVNVYKEQLKDWSAVFQEHAKLNLVFLNPKIPKTRKIALAKQLFMNHSAIVLNFMQLLVQTNRVQLLPQIDNIYCELADDFLGRLPAQVCSATSLSKDQSAKVLKVLNQRFKKQIIPEFTADSGLLGGMVVKVGSLVFDGSIRNQLDSFIEQIYLK